MKPNLISVLCCLFLASSFSTLNAQKTRFFIDIPAFYAQVPNLLKANEAFGLGASLGLAVGGHHYKVGLTGGTDANATISGGKFNEKIDFRPYVQAEFGGGWYRTNGQKCSIHNRRANTFLPCATVRYDFSTQKIYPLVGLQMSTFNIRDMFKNTEVFLNADYNILDKIPTAAFGLRIFLNMNNRD